MFIPSIREPGVIRDAIQWNFTAIIPFDIRNIPLGLTIVMAEDDTFYLLIC